MAFACINTSSKEYKDLLEQTGLPELLLQARISIWQKQNDDYESFPKYGDIVFAPNVVKANMKAIGILSSPSAQLMFAKATKNNWPLSKTLDELKIPKEQKELILQLNETTPLDIITSLLANYSFTVEINTAKQRKVGGQFYKFQGKYYHAVTNKEVSEEKALQDSETPTQHYSNLTVPGGTNYTENEIATPGITPSIKGHAQFATNNGIGWFRSDDQTKEGTGKIDEWDDDKNQRTVQNFVGGEATKTRRILEVQSDLFQKGRNKEILAGKRQFDHTQGRVIENLDQNGTQNQFLQLLNKDNNWVTFFVKSIIQDSAKKGYEKVLFPKGDTASKVEGHTTLEQFKKQKQDRIKELEDKKEKYKNDIESDKEIFNTSRYEDAQKEITQLKQELERVEGPEGFGALKPIYNFYENIVSNIVLKQFGKDNVREITDEYGNTWNEVTLNPKRDASEIMYQNVASDITKKEFLTSEKTIRDLAARISDRIGIPYRIISDRTEQYKGKIENNQAIINLAYATLDTPIHEILGHPIIRAIKNGNKFQIEENLTEKDADKIIEKNQVIEKNGIRYLAAYDAPDGTIIYRYDKTIQTNPKTGLYQNLLKELEYGTGKEILDRIKRDYEIKNVINETKVDNPLPDINQYGVDITDHISKLINTGDSLESIVKTLRRDFLEADHEWLYFNYPGYEPEYYGDEPPAAQTTVEEVLSLVQSMPFKVTYYTLEEQQEEALVELLGLMTAGKLDNVKDGKLISLLKRLLKEMKAFVRGLLGQREIEIDKLPDNMTIGDIADILAYSNSKLILPGYEVEYTTPDNQKFKTYAEASNHISELAKSIKDVDLEKNISIKNIDKEIETLQKELDNFKFEIEPFNKFIDVYTNKGRLRQNYWARKKDGTTWWTGGAKETLLEPEYDGFVLDINRGDGKFITKISDEEAEKLYYAQENKFNITTKESKEKYAELEIKIHNLKYNSLKGFIEKNKEYEQSKEIIEEWKKVNNIKYNPEEIYSRGQEFTSVVGAYSNFDVNLMMQNLLQHIEDNEKAGGKFAISAFTKPIDKRISHLEGDGGKIKFKIYPQSKDILWAANSDVYSGSVWDASQKVSKDKKSELLGVSYTKYPTLHNINAVQPNLASIIDELAHHHNELGIVLTGNNFRLEYDDDIPYSTKKIIDSINKILDQKYGKLVKPKIDKIQIKYQVIDKNNKILKEFTNDLDAHIWIGDESKKVGYRIDANVVKVEKGIKPTQTKDTLKESIDSIKIKELSNFSLVNGIESSMFVKYNKTTNLYEAWDKTIGFLGDTFKTKKEAEIFTGKNNKEYIEQALINNKIAKLKEVAKKYPRSLIRSEVKEIGKFSYAEMDFDEMAFQKIPSQPIKEGVAEVFEQNPELVLIGTAQEYSDYLDTIFPESKVKDVVYHGSASKIDKFDVSKSKISDVIYFSNDIKEAKYYANKIPNDGVFIVGDYKYTYLRFNDNDYFLKKKVELGTEKLSKADAISKYSISEKEYKEARDNIGNLNPSLINIKNLYQGVGEDLFFGGSKHFKDLGYDGFITNNDAGHPSILAVFEPEQIHILGSEDDMQKFQEYMDFKNNVKDYFNLNEEDAKFVKDISNLNDLNC